MSCLSGNGSSARLLIEGLQGGLYRKVQSLFWKIYMQSKLNLYTIDMKYIRNLHNTDDHVMSVSPQTGKSHRLFLGIVVICRERKYCIPLSSPKPKHAQMKDRIDFIKIYNSKPCFYHILSPIITDPLHSNCSICTAFLLNPIHKL